MAKASIFGRILVGSLASVAALTFFFPLLTFQIPLIGRQQVTGSDVVAKIRDFHQKLHSAYGNARSGDRVRIPLPKSRTSSPGEGRAESGLPLSVRASWLIPVCILTAIFCALLAMVGVLFLPVLARTASVVGALCALVALGHIQLMNSDVHSLFQQSLRSGVGNPAHSTFSGFAQALGGMLINAFQIQPGSGLYTLALCLILAAILSVSGLLTSRGESQSA